MLLTAGCSFVWGDELEGFTNTPPTHWDLTFTAITARALGIDYANRGICGACNEKIFREVTDFLHTTTETVTHMVVMWSAWQRKEHVEYMPPAKEHILGRQQNVTQFSSLRTNAIYTTQMRESMDNLYNTAYDSKTDIMHTITNMKALEIICKAKNIKLIQGVFHNRNWSNLMYVLNDITPLDATRKSYEGENLSINDIPEYKKWLTDSLGSLKPNSRIGLGRGKDLYTIGEEIHDIKEFGHPGERSQEVFSEFLLETFENSSD
jgi:hypothetical protein|tara:strand:- start:2376 stop:3167 length:792 start_codon:yes stop_codon:yes gene_type:complete